MSRLTEVFLVPEADTPCAARARRRGLWLAAVAALGLGAFLAWAHFFALDEWVRAPGQVIALARTRVIQVDGGEQLAQRERSRAEAGYTDSRGKVAALKAAAARLEAEVFGRVLEFPEAARAYPAFIRNQSELYERRRQALRQGEEAIEHSLRLVRRELALIEPLLAAGDIGETEVIRLQRQEVELRGQLVNLRNQYFQAAQVEMTRVEEALNTQEQVLVERRAILEHSELRAPANGQVRNIASTALGAAVRPRDRFMELLPSDSELIVEARLQAADRAFVHVGLPVIVNLDAWDPSLYGPLAGEVRYVSPHALSERLVDGEASYYRIFVRVTPASAARNGKRIQVQPGMTAQVEIRTGQHSVLAYLNKAISTAINEG